MGWRYQMPFLIGMGLRVVAPDMMGYGRTVRLCDMQYMLENLLIEHRMLHQVLKTTVIKPPPTTSQS